MTSEMEGKRLGESLKRRPLERTGSDNMNSSPLKRSNVGDDASMREPEDVSEVMSSLRFLLSNAAAGAIIGKGGSVIQEFQAQAGAIIHLSRTREFFPGTTERIIVLSGTVSAILTALHLILSKIRAEEGSGNSASDEDTYASGQVRLVVPNSVCGAVIGKGGVTIRSFMEDSGAAIKLSSQEASPPGVTDRLVTVGGTLEQQLRAVALVLTKIAEEPLYAQYGAAPLAYKVPDDPAPAFRHLPPAMLSSGGRGRAHVEASFPWEPARSQVQVIQTGLATTTVTVAVPDEHVGAVVGKGGTTINEIMRVAGVTIKLSDRGDFIEGTTNRRLAISGGTDAVLGAQHLISQKVKDNAALLSRSMQARDLTLERARPRPLEHERAPVRRERDREFERERDPLPREREWDHERPRDVDRFREYERNGIRPQEEERHSDRDLGRGDDDRGYRERFFRPMDRR